MAQYYGGYRAPMRSARPARVQQTVQPNSINGQNWPHNINSLGVHNFQQPRPEMEGRRYY